MELTKHRRMLLSAFRLDAEKIQKSTGIEMREVVYYLNGYETEVATNYTMHSLFDTLESEISNTNRKLNLVK